MSAGAGAWLDLAPWLALGWVAGVGTCLAIEAAGRRRDARRWQRWRKGPWA